MSSTKPETWYWEGGGPHLGNPQTCRAQLCWEGESPREDAQKRGKNVVFPSTQKTNPLLFRSFVGLTGLISLQSKGLSRVFSSIH